jgi:O-antigen ligase
MAVQFRTLLPGKENAIFEWLCIAIVYSLLFWTGGNSGFIILLTAYWLFFKKKTFALSLTRIRLMLLFCSLYLVSLIGLAYTSNLTEGIFRLQQKSAIFFFPLVFGTIVLPAKTYQVIRVHFIIATCLACFISLLHGLVRFYKTGNSAMLTREQLAIFPDLNPPMTGLICLLAIILLLHHYYDGTRKSMLPVITAVTFLASYTILMGVRLLIFCLFIILLVFIIRYIHSIVYKITLAGAFIFVTALSLVFIPSLNRKWKELVDFSPQNTITLDKDSSLGKSWGGKSIRIAIWDCSTDIIRRNWLFGVGTGDVQDSLQAAYMNRKFYFAAFHNRYNAHNQYLEMWLANGLPGLIIYILCLVVPLVMHARNGTALDYVLFLCLVIMISFTETFLNVNKGIIWYSFFNSIFGFAYLQTSFTPVRPNKVLS